jgi:hypothetical protein
MLIPSSYYYDSTKLAIRDYFLLIGSIYTLFGFGFVFGMMYVIRYY